ncbi:MAG: Rpn family recombination-promoting nuclease/putative transposase, partial [Thermodesulfobium sp.]
MSKIKAHDRFVRALMTKPKVIREFFDHHLPEKIKKCIDFSSIEPQKESFVDDKLRLQIADLLYSVKFNGEPGYLYILLEH